MHELSLMEAVRDQALAAARGQGGGRITAIHLRIGSLAGVEIEALRLAAQVVLEGCEAQGATLRITAVPARAHCGPCDRPFPVRDGVCACPVCGAISRRLLQGRELDLIALDLAEPGETGP